MKCRICGTQNKACFTGSLLNKYNVEYYQCAKCDFVQTESPYWLEEAYDRPINISDTGYMVRNLYFKKKLTILLYLLFGDNAQFVDYAGGYGVFVRLMRDVGFDFKWYDKYTQNLFSSGFEWDEISKVDAVTLFEVFEHFVDPLEELGRLLKISDTIIFSTELHPTPLPTPRNWWYYGLDHGQHLSFYSVKSLTYMAKKFQTNYYRMGSLHILTKNNISKYVLLSTKLSKLGLSRMIEERMSSRVWTDYNKLTKEK